MDSVALKAPSKQSCVPRIRRAAAKGVTPSCIKEKMFEMRRLLLVPAVALVTMACGSTAANTSSGSSPSTSMSIVVKEKAVSVGGQAQTVLADSSGLTLYYFTPDKNGAVTCTGSCAQAWPPLLLASGTPEASGSLSGTLSAVSGANGRQVAYNGHPLYRYAGDKSQSDAKGQGQFGKWFVATTSLSPAGASPSPSSGGYGY